MYNTIMIWGTVYLVRHHFVAGRYEKVLGVIRVAASNHGEAFVYYNIIRIVSLNKTQDPQWKVEIAWLINNAGLEQVTENDRVYLKQYLNKTLGEDIFEDIEKTNIDKDVVSKKIISFFH